VQLLIGLLKKKTKITNMNPNILMLQILRIVAVSHRILIKPTLVQLPLVQKCPELPTLPARTMQMDLLVVPQEHPLRKRGKVVIRPLNEATQPQLRIYIASWSLEMPRMALLTITKILLSQTELWHQTSVLVRMTKLMTKSSEQRPNTRKAVQLADRVHMPLIITVAPTLE
jgi:hypothetical protein